MGNIKLGPSFLPNADIARNVCYPRTHQSQNGQEETFGAASLLAHSCVQKQNGPQLRGPSLDRYVRSVRLAPRESETGETET